MKVVIYNDTTTAFGMHHFGCQLVMESLHDLLSDFEIIGSIALDNARQMKWPKSLLKKADLIIANGEGSFHHNRRPDFVQLAREYPVALINSVYDSNDHTEQELNRFKYIAVRETSSAAALQKQGIECHVVPDVIFTSKYLAGIKPDNGGGPITVAHFHGVYTLQDKTKVVPVIASSDAVRTGSYHGACVAIYYCKAVIVWESNSHKMQGLARDAGINCISHEREAADVMKARKDYKRTAQKRIRQMITALHNL